ncbi:MAG: hypothetical protein P8N76_22000 [Pirellulaceae bacterium]|nr:hypothetical protein [Pirellulaceae bacterium]
MSEVRAIPVGGEVPDFTLDTYDPVPEDFGSISLSDLKEQGKLEYFVLLSSRLHLCLSDRVCCSGRAVRPF